MNTYQSYRGNIRSGDTISFSRQGGNPFLAFIFYIISAVTGSTWYHTGTAYVIGGRVFIIEAVWPRVRIYPLGYLGSFYHMGLDINFTEESERMLLSQVGKPYSIIKAIIAVFLTPRGTASWQCSMLNIEFLKANGYPDHWDQYTPGGCVNTLVERYGKNNEFVKN